MEIKNDENNKLKNAEYLSVFKKKTSIDMK